MGALGFGAWYSGDGSTAVASVIVTCGIWVDARLSQDCEAELIAGSIRNPVTSVIGI